MSPSPRLRIYSALEWQQETGDVVASESGLEFSGLTGLPDGPHGGRHPETSSWRAGVSLVENRTPGATPSSVLGFRFGLVPAGRWSLEFTGRYQLEEFGDGPGWTDTRLGVLRDFHDWDLRFSVWHDPAEGDSGVSMSIAPRGYPVNLPPATR